MIIAERLRQIRDQKNLSQADIERKTGLLPCYISRVENGHTVPSVETLEKFARALDVPMYQLFYAGDEPPEPLDLPEQESEEDAWSRTGEGARLLAKFRRLFGSLKEDDRGLLFSVALKLAQRNSSSK
jgi:transcriptional regulator with XRE-family HTH domain